ncbi:Mitochondrial import inner membrane translocase subunit tim8 [Tieghemiomyces parasiticus]|uniref:Mitochondrial import inner membrane translocase subunit n=1 Tax=Tieghemiomyces parasiticus TaxID=78921 RepID=A0A9W8A775_9FUNG|nr:Mitochondrial import inner membrane translocase subunit tim8 [Tieghemiomyces parasiticus]
MGLFTSNTHSNSPAATPGGPDKELKEFVEQQEQLANLQNTVRQLTEMCYTPCVPRVDSTLSSSERQCLANCVNRYFDSMRIVVEQMTNMQN